MDRNATSPMATVSSDAILEELHAEFSRLRSLFYVYVAILMVTGLLGNLLVVVVYVTKFKATATRSFIVAMAVLDLVNCVVGMPLDILTLASDNNDHIGISCKVLGGTCVCTYFGSALLLVVVASDRFRKICRPLASQLTVRGANRAVAGCGLITLIFAWPFVLFSGQRRVNIEGIDVTVCHNENRFDNTLYPLIYNSVLFLIFLGGCVVLMALYSRIILQIRSRQISSQSPHPSLPDTVTLSAVLPAGSISADQGTQAVRSPSESLQHGDEQSPAFSMSSTLHSIAVNENCEDNPADLSGDESSQEEATDHTDVSQTSNWNSGFDMEEPTSMNAQDNTSDGANHTLGDKDARKIAASTHRIKETRKLRCDAIVRKTTFTLFLVTLVYVLSFLPFLVVRTLTGLDIVSGYTVSSLTTLELFDRSPFIQSAANPLIYGIRHPEFRDKCRRLFSGFKRNTFSLNQST